LLRRFQAHERKRDRLEVMRAQFEADKARIAKLRADRKFRPY
jgi:ribosomal RNA-processing protein 7